jgi:phosphonate degradation associated HDIG domain protein
MALSISDICVLFARKGGRAYAGEPVNQIEHALQTAMRAEDDGAGPALVTAALLHDLGHLLNDQGESPTLRGVDDLHQYAALPFLRALFADDVLVPIRLHVDAKRYLCAKRSGYYDALSLDSKRSLALQGGIYSQADADIFAARIGATRAVELRVWDDSAKTAGAKTPPLAYFMRVMQAARRA